MLQAFPGENWRARANAQDDNTDYARVTTNFVKNTSYVMGGVFQHSSPYVTAYWNGTAEATYVTDDYTNPEFGSTFAVGGQVLLDPQEMRGIVQKVCIFSCPLTNTKSSTVSSLLGYD